MSKSQKRCEVLALISERRPVREIWDMTGVTPRGIRTIAGQDAPEYLKWMDSQVASDYEAIGRRRTMFKWVLTRGMMNDVLSRMGVPMKSDAWSGKRGGRPRYEDVAHPLMTRAISMKWVQA